jgi:hypothetical protein
VIITGLGSKGWRRRRRKRKRRRTRRRLWWRFMQS